MKKFLAFVAVVALVAFAAPAFAANPFMDVPMNSWAYDAISQLSATGVVSGYPDGTFKGNQPMTRYEMASIVARALAVVDMNKASKQDVEMLKKLVVEFKDELDALGVQVDELDSRVAVLEENLGGWKIKGGFRFDWYTADETDGIYKSGTNWDDTDMGLGRARFHFYKTVNDKVSFYGRLNGENPSWMRYRIDVVLPYDIDMRAGKFCWDWESDLYWVSGAGSWQTDSTLGDYTLYGYHFTKDFSMGTAKVILSRNDAAESTDEFMMYGVDVSVNFTEQFAMDFAYLNKDFEEGDDLGTWWVLPKFDFGNGMVAKGAFYQQDTDNDPTLWRAIFTVDQDVTGFSSFWLEYDSVEAGFQYQNAAFGLVTNPDDCGIFDATSVPFDVDVLQVMGIQQWNDKWDTWFRYANFDADNGNELENITVGIDYLYADAVKFQLMYDTVEDDFGTVDDSLIHFRTALYW